ncbi:MAG TPA: sensor histidine kinase [Phycisphaerae bacterium]|nr:sensor histidine kinase [Phycisphaerae bacterium]HOJ75574.1 sensor histidine kinase [Phycisphaerae bacterium]HOM50228.1 sensor histidine kinase [Phycisphaerae bacterium]HON64872.1 sensor histidine kinase [Phycisphaerae bacterium]HOQ88361.1 sensor histidine kinase [Phycisphaerae bacterium]
MVQSDGEEPIIANVRDQSAEEAYLAQIRRLTLDAARALEEERARISRELHDELGQTLTAINLNLAWLTSRSTGWDVKTQERLTEAKQFVNQLLDSVRSLSTSLRPPILDNRDLREAVRSYAAEFSRRSGIACRAVAVPTDLEVHDPVATTLFRIFQEAMTNVARHSLAAKCGIFLRSVGPEIELKVRDSGVGAVPKRLEGVQSLGIAGMRERAASMGGTLVVQNRPEGGVCVTARLPWRQAEKRNNP